ncbi:MAG: hypothetical protein HF982_12230 [Desulfobacteraceae bacterium]|nr:hypothetical protein [Desulfobacteraceae bacterium]MBC2720328.1 hypothetical protein [Desulfobacteraceae bacterium]
MVENKDVSPKEVAYYSALVQAWITTKLDHDKTIITLSSAGIGLIVTLLATVSPNNVAYIILYILSTFGFCLAIISATTVLKKNSKYIEQVIKGKRDRDPYLRYWDSAMTIGFYAGIVFLIIIDIISGLNNLKEVKEVKKMATDRIEKTTNRSDDYNSRSLDDIGKIAPSTESTGSSDESDN